jgi:hypothetical protein
MARAYGGDACGLAWSVSTPFTLFRPLLPNFPYPYYFWSILASFGGSCPPLFFRRVNCPLSEKWFSVPNIFL